MRFTRFTSAKVQVLTQTHALSLGIMIADVSARSDADSSDAPDFKNIKKFTRASHVLPEKKNTKIQKSPPAANESTATPEGIVHEEGKSIDTNNKAKPGGGGRGGGGGSRSGEGGESTVEAEERRKEEAGALT